MTGIKVVSTRCDHCGASFSVEPLEGSSSRETWSRAYWGCFQRCTCLTREEDVPIIVDLFDRFGLDPEALH